MCVHIVCYVIEKKLSNSIFSIRKLKKNLILLAQKPLVHIKCRKNVVQMSKIYTWNYSKFQGSFDQTRSKKKPQHHRFLIQYRWAVLRTYVCANAIISRTDHPVKSWFAVAQKHREVIRAIGQLNSIVTTTELLTRETRNVHVATGHKIRLVESPNLYYARFRDWQC